MLYGVKLYDSQWISRKIRVQTYKNMTKLFVCKDILYYKTQVSVRGIANKNRAYLAN